MPPAATTPLESKICTRFVQFWAMAQLIDFVVGNATGGGTWEHLQLAAVLVAGMLPNRSVPVVVAFALRAACVAVRAPWAWDGEFLTACTEVAFVAHVLLGGPDGVAAMGETIRSQMAIFYWFAGFWKVNTAFLNPKYSCGSVYFVQLLDAYVPESLLTQELVSFAVNVAPAATIVLECSIGVAMAFACWKPFSRSSTNATSTWGKLGVILGSMLHFGIALTPKPNNIALFGVMVAVRYFWFAPAGSASAIDEVLRSPLRVGAVHVLAAATLVGATLACQEGSDALTEVQDGRRPLSSLDRPMFAWSILTTLLLRGIMLDGTVNGASSQDCSMSASSRWTHRTVSVVGFTVVLFWTLGPLLGLQDIGTPNMFSNLRQQGGSNHYVLPTSVLQSVYQEDLSSAYSGGVIRIESTNATQITGHFPAEQTSILTERTSTLLRAAGHSGRMFNSAVARIIGPFAVPPPAHDAPKYTLPAFEVRRLLEETRASGQAFELTYTQLKGNNPDTRWLGSGDGRTVQLYEDGATDVEQLPDPG